jgi:late competence protein required for DNA uptake (superfamily II DNA/RNA helicase)
VSISNLTGVLSEQEEVEKWVWEEALSKCSALLLTSGSLLLLQQILKLNCERCKLRTEHYVQMRDGAVVLCRCLRCGQPKMKQSLAEEDPRSYPQDDRRPIYVS